MQEVVVTAGSARPVGTPSLAASVDPSLGAMGASNWGRMLGSAAVFGSAFLWIALALESLSPGTIAFGRAALGAAALALLPAARCRIVRADWGRLVVASFFGIAAPVFLFALAEQRVSSALAGMLVSGIPILTAVVVAVETRTMPTRLRALGLVIGGGGILLLAAPKLADSRSDAVGVVMVLGAVLAYAIATTLYAPLQQSYGSLRVTMWVLVVSSVLLLPLGVLGLEDSSWEWKSGVALVVLGVLGTGIVWAMFVGLAGRVGAVRALITGYLIPIFALVLGMVFLDETVEAVQLAGVALALVGGYVLGRAPVRREAVPVVEAVPPSGVQMCR